MGIDDIKAPRRPARDLLIDAMTEREAFQTAVVAGQVHVSNVASCLPLLSQLHQP